MKAAGFDKIYQFPGGRAEGEGQINNENENHDSRNLIEVVHSLTVEFKSTKI